MAYGFNAKTAVMILSSRSRGIAINVDMIFMDIINDFLQCEIWFSKQICPDLIGYVPRLTPQTFYKEGESHFIYFIEDIFAKHSEEKTVLKDDVYKMKIYDYLEDIPYFLKVQSNILKISEVNFTFPAGTSIMNL